MKKQEENLTGKKFGKLTVMKQISATSCLCRCECGNKRTVYINSLLKGHVRSCGCLYRQSTRQAIAAKNKNMVEVIKKQCKTMVLNPNPTAKNKTSNRKGVCFNKISGKFMAYINVNGKRLYLGEYKQESEASAAREKAEVMYFSA